MTNLTMSSLRELQRLDSEIHRIRDRIQAFDPLLADAEEPALRLESELAKGRERLDQMRADARRLERNADDKRARAKRLSDRLNQVSNLREEAAVRTELDLVRRALEGEEQEALQLLEQLQRMELLVDELAEAAGEARAEVEPNQRSLLEERGALKEQLEELNERRDELIAALGAQERRVYESFHGSGRRIVVATLTEDGACGHCFGMVPPQLQNEIRSGGKLLRCEACGVVLTAEPEPEPEEAEAPPAPEAAAESEDVSAEAGDPSEEARPDS